MCKYPSYEVQSGVTPSRILGGRGFESHRDDIRGAIR